MKISRSKLREIIKSVIVENYGQKMKPHGHNVNLSDCNSVLECCKKMLKECPQMGIQEIAQCIYDEYCQGVCKTSEVIGCVNECLMCIKNGQDADLCCDCVEVMLCMMNIERRGGAQMPQSAMVHQPKSSHDLDHMGDGRFLENEYC